MHNLKIVFFKAFFLVTLFSSSVLNAQEMNANFLNSLPTSIQKDFLNDEIDDSLEDNYNERPDTRIKKIESGIDDIRSQLSSMESRINREKGIETTRVFGSNFFDSYQTSFAPINEKNFASDYVIDVGDLLSVQTLGETSIKRKVNVTRDGTINIPELGIIQVAGLPYEDAINKIKQYVSNKFIGLEIYVNLEVARDMSVLLIGNAYNPGIYTLPGGSNILSLLHAAGGISEGGSFRSILHKRNNEVIQEIDLYDILISGNLLFASPVRSGDSVIIQPAKRLVLVSGGINIPALYELKDDEKFNDLINFAQGYSLSSKNKAAITSAQGDNYELSRQLSESHILRHGDSVMIPMFEPMPETIYTLSISGGVKKPGIYSFKKGATLHEMIAIAGGFSETAYPFGGALYRKKAAEIQRDSFEKSYSQLINFLATNTSRGSAVITNSQNLQVVLSELRAAKFKGRISAEFSSRKIVEDPSLDTVLADQDEIHIPEFTSDVYVSGDILNPGGRRYNSELDLYDYINQSGGLGRFADSERIIVIKPNGDADVVKASRLFSASSTIYPGTTIFVPKEIGKLEGISYVATLAPIVSSLALSLASLNSIN